MGYLIIVVLLLLVSTLFMFWAKWKFSKNSHKPPNAEMEDDADPEIGNHQGENDGEGGA